MPVRVFPFEAVRDLIGILRVVYAHEAGDRLCRKERLATIKRFADELRSAVAMAAVHDPGTAPYERALSKADGVALRLGDIYVSEVGISDHVDPLVHTAGCRVRGVWAPYEKPQRELKWEGGKTRG